MNQPDRNNKTAVVTRISNNIPLSILVSLFIFVTLIRKIHSMGWIALLFIVPFVMFLLWRMWKLGTLGELLRADTYVWLSNAVIFGCGIYYWDYFKNHKSLIFIILIVIVPLMIDFVKEVMKGDGDM